MKLEKTVPSVAGAPSIALIEAVGHCPPEDCGGARGYEILLEILADPEHEEYEETVAWCGGPFDPSHADAPTLQAALDQLAKRWMPRTNKRRAN